MTAALKVFTGFLLLSIAATGIRAVVEPQPVENPGISLHWNRLSIRVGLSSSLVGQNPNIKTGTNVGEVVRRSLSIWENVSAVKLVPYASDKQSVSPAGISGDGTSLITIAQTPENLAFFQNDTQSSPARTRVFYDRRGEITEADIVLNPFVQFSDDGTLGTFDLESTITHEIGHLLGLTHSFSLGSAMYGNYGRNGLFGLQARSARTLSPEDVAAVRALYGDGTGDEGCCGTVSGRLAFVGRPAANFQVWAEDAETGQIAGTTITNKTGTYRLEGLAKGSYRIYAQDDGKKLPGSATFQIATMEVVKGKTISLDAAQLKRSVPMEVRYVGLSGQLADAPIPMNGGRTYTVYFGGSNLNAARASLGTNSKFITINSETVANVDFNDRITVIRAEVTIDADAPAGDYSIFVQSGPGVRRYLVGGITVEPFVDPWDISSIVIR
jgi:hypothetical protein